MALAASDTDRNPKALAYVDASGDPVLVKPATPLPVIITPAGADGLVGTGATTSVASSTNAGTILAANAARYGATVYNDDANGLYLLLGAGTVSATVYTVLVPSGGYYEVPYGFTGILTGLWAGDGSGSARITEFT